MHIIICDYMCIYISHIYICVNICDIYRYSSWYMTWRTPIPGSSGFLQPLLACRSARLKKILWPGSPVGYPLEDLSPSMFHVFHSWVMEDDGSFGPILLSGQMHVMSYCWLNHDESCLCSHTNSNPIIFPWYPPNMMDLFIISCSRITLVGFITRISGQTQIFVCYIAAFLMVKPPNRSLMFVGRHTQMTLSIIHNQYGFGSRSLTPHFCGCLCK
jgi:hypothetical protein